MKKTVKHYLLRKKNNLTESRLASKNYLFWQLALCLLLTLLPQITSAQTIPNEGSPDWLWVKSAGGSTTDQATSVTTDDAGNIYTTGTFTGTATFGKQTLTSAGAADIFISKHDAHGKLIWVKRAGGTGADQASKIIVDAASNNFYIAGNFSGSATFSNNDLVSEGGLFIAKYSPTGEVLWVKAEGNAGFKEFNISTSGHLYLSGSFSGSITIGNHTITTDNNNFYSYGSNFIAKYDNAGNVLWAQDAGGEGGHAFGVSFDAAGNAYATGIFFDTVVFGDTTFTEQSDPDVGSNFIVKYNANGNVVWANQRANFVPGSIQNGITTDLAGNVYVTGQNHDGITYSIYILKYDAAGNYLWGDLVDSNDYFVGIVSLLPDAAGNIYIAYNAQHGGRQFGDFPEISAAFNKYDAAGNIVARENIYFEGLPHNEYDQSVRASNMVIDAIGRVYFSFSFRGTAHIGSDSLITSDSDSNVFSAIYDPDGTFLSVHTITVTSLAEKGNNTYLAGSFKDTVSLGNTTLTSNGDTDVFLAKITYDSTPLLSSWNQTYGGKSNERLTSVLKTNDGGYLLGGHSLSRHGGDRSQDSQGSYDFWVVKTDANGNKLWDKRYGGSDDDYLNSIVPTQDRGYLLAGSSKSGVSGDKSQSSRGSQDFWVVKIDSTGEKQWDQTYGGSGFEDLRQALHLFSGEYVLAGVSDSPVSGEQHQYQRGSRDYWLVKISSTGELLWDRRYGGSKAEELGSVVIVANGGFVLGGSSLSGKSGEKTSASKGGKDYWLVRTNAEGFLLWDKSYGGSGEDQLMVIASTTSGELLLAGNSSSGVSSDKTQPSRGNSDYWFLKTDLQGKKIWDKTYGGSEQEALGSLIATYDGGWLLGGSSFSNQSGEKSQNSKGSSDYWVVKLDEEGEQEWDQTYGGTGEDRLRYLLQTEDQGYLLAGFSFSGQSGDKSQNSQGRSDYWLVKIPPTPATQSRMAAQPAAEITPNVAARNFRAYPVPASDRVTVQFTLPQTQPAVVQLYNSQGSKVKTLFRGEVQANKTYQVEWQPSSQDSNGLYFLQLQAKQQKKSLKILLQK